MGWHFQKHLKATVVKLFRHLKDQENMQRDFQAYVLTINVFTFEFWEIYILRHWNAFRNLTVVVPQMSF